MAAYPDHAPQLLLSVRSLDGLTAAESLLLGRLAAAGSVPARGFETAASEWLGGLAAKQAIRSLRDQGLAGYDHGNSMGSETFYATAAGLLLALGGNPA